MSRHYNVTWMSFSLKSLAIQHFVYQLMWTHIKETSKSALLTLCEGNSPVTGEFPTQRTSNGENASMWSHHNDVIKGSMVTAVLVTVCQWLIHQKSCSNHTAQWSNNHPSCMMITQLRWYARPYLMWPLCISWGNNFCQYSCSRTSLWHWPLLLTWFNFNPSMDK